MSAFDSADRTSRLNKYLKSSLGDPIFPIIEEEEHQIQYATEKALERYYQTIPYVQRKTMSVSAGVTGSISLSYDSLLTELIDAGAQDSAYFIGVIHSDMYQLFQGAEGVDRILLGEGVRSGSSINLYDPMGDIDRATQVDSRTGEADVFFDETKQAIIILPATSGGTLTIDTAWGFTSIDYVRRDLWSLFADMVLREVLDYIATGINRATLSADFEISSDVLKEKFTRLDEKIEEELKVASPPVMVQG